MINKSIILVALFFQFNVVFAQIRAVTEEGDSIYVYDNGKWSYDLLEEEEDFNSFDFLKEDLIIDTISSPFKYSENCNKEVVSKIGVYKFKYDSTLFKRIPPGSINPDAEFAFQSKDKSTWCIIIQEPTEIPGDKLLKVARKLMADKIGSEVEILKVESRIINGKEVIRGVLSCNISGIDFIFDSYYYSDERGSIQVSSWSSKGVWKSKSEGNTKFLNGFIINDM